MVVDMVLELDLGKAGAMEVLLLRNLMNHSARIVTLTGRKESLNF